MSGMGLLFFVEDYVVWHYGRGTRDLGHIIASLLAFTYRFFSIRILSRTLVTPFARIRVSGADIIDIGAVLQNLTANLVARAVGFFLRVFVITAGILSGVAIAVAGLIALLLWLLMPALILLALAAGAGLFS